MCKGPQWPVCRWARGFWWHRGRRPRGRLVLKVSVRIERFHKRWAAKHTSAAIRLRSNFVRSSGRMDVFLVSPSSGDKMPSNGEGFSSSTSFSLPLFPPSRSLNVTFGACEGVCGPDVAAVRAFLVVGGRRRARSRSRRL